MKRNDQKQHHKHELQAENARRIDDLINTVERYTRTERHLEQHSDISSPEQIQHAKQIQNERKEHIENLKNIIAYGEHANADTPFENLKQNYEYTEGYLNNNADHLDEETINNIKEKQQHRKDQMKFMR
ncbi:hypothetical protein SAMN05661008_00622 [Alkalithermobacter thermoalcaliphilus JW-YL-7 = DSM 7308]|uniref:Uncharacterized protein n=1 Tax=Alkalithermobacter thermoalcaliphilus JW-YL-7 = DSM 7308 TaxID=1121328 RepID=A0A150FRN6_CLOPD|nr:hypothetical protein JWYL7_0775 [[Clostridium] paradoxum JW-YL-7 = DSM 7308]SHK64216.1 hypothetical protein SAMN05661008_00622 [[Clostridium] paradoxum JW-YL-7 = DSM 7308]